MQTSSRERKTGYSRPEPKISRENSSAGTCLTIQLCGKWKITEGLTETKNLENELGFLFNKKNVQEIRFDCQKLEEYDSSLICYLIRCESLCTNSGTKFSKETLPEGIQKLLQLSIGRRGYKLPPRIEDDGDASLIYTIGTWGEKQLNGWRNAFSFLGETSIAFGRLFRGKAQFRKRDCLYFIQHCGADSLPIITLISFITGVILAYIGAMQLQKFGAIIYVASLIALAMVREMGVIMSGVIMCGRTGSAFAAQIGSMQASEEISALKTLGINPIDHLVLPRIIALSLMLPLLTVYSDFVGMLGGLFVMGTMDVTLEQYWHQIVITLKINHLMSGLIKSVFFGFLIAWAGCYRGMNAQKSSLSVGDAATSAAVLGMLLLVIGDGLFAVIFNAIGI